MGESTILSFIFAQKINVFSHEFLRNLSKLTKMSFTEVNNLYKH